jgi:hypothetical protein
MPPAGNPLTHLARRLARKETEVQRLRRVYETRLAALKNRREELAEKLRRIDAQSQAVAPESPEASEGPTPSEEPAPSEGRAKRGTLPALIVKLIHRAGHPLTVKQLSEDMRRRRFPTTSKNIPQLVQNRVSEWSRRAF